MSRHQIHGTKELESSRTKTTVKKTGYIRPVVLILRSDILSESLILAQDERWRRA